MHLQWGTPLYKRCRNHKNYVYQLICLYQNPAEPNKNNFAIWNLEFLPCSEYLDIFFEYRIIGICNWIIFWKRFWYIWYFNVGNSYHWKYLCNFCQGGGAKYFYFSIVCFIIWLMIKHCLWHVCFHIGR